MGKQIVYCSWIGCCSSILSLHAGGDHQRIGGRHPDEQLLLLLALDLAHGGGDQHHAGIGLEALVIDEADFLVLGLLALHAELDPSVLCRRGAGRADRSRADHGGAGANRRASGGRRFRNRRGLRLDLASRRLLGIGLRRRERQAERGNAGAKHQTSPTPAQRVPTIPGPDH